MILDVMKLFPKMFMGWGGGGDEGGGSDVSTATSQNEGTQAPDYAEATGARQNWWDTLQKWQSQPGYGAIQPDWNSIWENARGKVSRYFGGGPEGPGLDAKVKSGRARRGMAENPASDALLQRSGFQQGNMLQDLAVQQSTKEAALGETGRQTWLQSLMQLAGLKPQMLNTGSVKTITTPTQQTNAGTSGIMGLFGSGMFDGLLGGQGTDGGGGGLGGIMDLFGTGGADTGIGDIGGGDIMNSGYGADYSDIMGSGWGR